MWMGSGGRVHAQKTDWTVVWTKSIKAREQICTHKQPLAIWTQALRGLLIHTMLRIYVPSWPGPCKVAYVSLDQLAALNNPYRSTLIGNLYPNDQGILLCSLLFYYLLHRVKVQAAQAPNSHFYLSPAAAIRSHNSSAGGKTCSFCRIPSLIAHLRSLYLTKVAQDATHHHCASYCHF